jgi:SSS family solute:Na+ symporter
MDTGIAIAIGLVLYVVLTTAVSLLMLTRVRQPADYLMAGRGLPFWVLVGTISGTCIGTGVIIGGSGLAYQHGWAGCAYPIGLGLGTLLTGLCFAGMRKYKFMTLAEEMACYFDGNRVVAEFASISLFLSQLFWLAVQIMGGAAVLGAVTGLPPRLCIVLAGFAKAAITIPGGLKAVVYTDVLQTAILFIGFAFLVHLTLHNVGGWDGLRRTSPPEYFSFLGVASYGTWSVISLILVMTSNPLADPARRLTMYSAKTERSAKWSMVISGLLVMAFSVVIGITGMYAHQLNPHLPRAEQALPWLVLHSLPAWLAALIVVAMVAGISSAANGTGAAASTFFVRHIFPLITGRFPRRPVFAARWLLVFMFLFSTTLALFTSDIVSFVVKFLPLTMSGLGVCLVFGRLWPRATAPGALAALITTPVVALGVMSFLGNPTLPAMLAGALALVVVSLLTPPKKFTVDQVAERMARERQSLEAAAPADPAKSLSPLASNADPI